VPELLQAAAATLVYAVALLVVRRFPPELQTALSVRRAGGTAR
jgi:hypothetical protein